MSTEQLTSVWLTPQESKADFTDKPKCAKCLSAKVELSYKKYRALDEHGELAEDVEYIRCQCGRCGFIWSMQTADANAVDLTVTQQWTITTTDDGPAGTLPFTVYSAGE